MSSTSLPPEGVRTTSDPPTGATRLVLLRHGQGKCNVQGLIGGRRGCTGLTELGRRQAALLASYVARTPELAAPSALVSSDLARATETMGIVARALGVPVGDVVVTQGLSELNPGAADALSWDEYRQRFTAPEWDLDHSVPLSPGGESWSGFVDRAGEALEDLVSSHPGGLVLAATHAGVIEASMLRFLVGSPSGAAHPRLRLRTAYGSLSEWEHSAGRFQLRSYNVVPSGL